MCVCVCVCLQAFNDDICFLVANNDGKGNAANVSIQIWNSNDYARNVGVSKARLDT